MQPLTSQYKNALRRVLFASMLSLAFQGLALGNTDSLKREFFENGLKKNRFYRKAPDSYRFFTWNVHKFRDVYNNKQTSEAILFIKEQGADVIGLQEVYQNYVLEENLDSLESSFSPLNHFWKTAVESTLDFSISTHICHAASNDLKNLGVDIDKQWTFKTADRKILPRQALALLTKLKVLAYDCHTFPREAQYLENEEIEPLSFIAAQLLTDKGPILVIVCHLDVYDSSGDTRRKQVEYIADYIADLHLEHVIVMGDFNSLNLRQLQRDPTAFAQILEADRARNSPTPLHEVLPLYQSAFNFTEIFDHAIAPKSTVWSNRKVDHIFASSGLRTGNSRVAFSHLSDHFGLVTDVRFGSKSKL